MRLEQKINSQSELTGEVALSSPAQSVSQSSGSAALAVFTLDSMVWARSTGLERNSSSDMSGTTSLVMSMVVMVVAVVLVVMVMMVLMVVVLVLAVVVMVVMVVAVVVVLVVMVVMMVVMVKCESECVDVQGQHPHRPGGEG